MIFNPTNDQSCQYYIIHKLSDNKTKIFRTIPIINKQFTDGTYFYDYIYKWLFEGYRKILAKPESVTFFVRELKGDAFTSGSLSNMIKHLCKRKTEVKVSPHKWRHIFVTYCAKSGMSLEEREAVAIYMNHSREIADQVYNKQTDLDKIQPFLKRINNTQKIKQ